jgi:hypothetical protein
LSLFWLFIVSLFCYHRTIRRRKECPAGPVRQRLNVSFPLRFFDQLEDILAERFKRPAKASKTKEETENG